MMFACNNYHITVQQKVMADKLLWYWCVHHSMTDAPILYSKLYSEQHEAIKFAEKFSLEMGLRFAKPDLVEKRLSLIKGGLYDR